ncbi:sigma-70 family RNA polymerase sigma factor [Nocardioides sp. CN2-186]|uniref:sigma-70 family RNA polymerase sigma factor n=1 Tax=Nocardioides tweenelious TaxID=3156607 RepID=UPI0032B3EF45
MAAPVSTIDGPSDAELISAVRGGDVDAYGDLFARHVEAARRLGRQLVPGPDVDDLVSEAFAKVLVVLQRGGGPDLAFRAYLLTAIRRLHVDRIRATSRLHTTDDLTPFDPGVPFRDTAVEGFESGAAARAFAALPERWQLVLWHTEVEEQKPAEVAVLLGMTPNSVSALAYRAREGLRQAYLSMHASTADDDACERTRAQLGSYVRGGLSRREAARVEQHLEECRACAAIYLELAEVNSDLRAVLAPLLLGAAAAAYLAGSAGGAATATGGVLVLLGRARDAVVTHGPTAAVAGAAASAVVAGLVLTLHHGDRPVPDAQDTPIIGSTPTAGQQQSPARRTPDQRTSSRTAVSNPLTGSAPTVSPTATPTTPPTADPTTTGPTSNPTSSGPTSRPSDKPSQGPPDEPRTTDPSPLVHVGATIAADPDGIGVGVDLGIAGQPLPTVSVTIPVPGAR